jgi:hypothetical protein
MRRDGELPQNFLLYKEDVPFDAQQFPEFLNGEILLYERLRDSEYRYSTCVHKARRICLEVSKLLSSARKACPPFPCDSYA